MILESNLNQVAKEIEEYKIAMKRKLENMVKHFIVDTVVQIATDMNPMGNAKEFPGWYARRFKATGLRPEEGFSRGSWQVVFDNNVQLKNNFGRDSGTTAMQQARTSIDAYQLGQSVYVVNLGPYINILQEKIDFKSRVPSLVEAAFKSNLQYYFDKG